MTAAVELNGWCIVTGQDFRESIFVKDTTLPTIPNPDYNEDCTEDINNRKELYQAKDLTDYEAKMDIRDSNTVAGNLIKALGTISGGITITALTGEVEIFIDNSETKIDPILSAAGSDAFYDLFLIPLAPEDNQRVLFGTIQIIGAVTNV